VRALLAAGAALAAGSAGAAVGLAETQAYAISAALLVGAGAAVASRAWTRQLLPLALGVLAWDLHDISLLVAEDAQRWVDPAFPLEGLLPLTLQSLRGQPLWMAGVAGGAALAWPGLGRLFLLAALGSGLRYASLVLAQGGLLSGEVESAARFAHVGLYAGPLVGLIGLGLAWGPREGRPSRLALALILALAATSPLGGLVARMPSPATALAVPHVPARPSVALPALQAPLGPALAARGDRPEPDAALPCTPAAAARWDRVPRRSAALALTAVTPVSALDEAVAEAALHQTHRLALVGRAPALPGPLGPLLQWPVVRLLVERPAHDAAFIAIAADGSLSPTPPGGVSCALLPDPGLTIGQLVEVARTLEPGRCLGLVYLPRGVRPAPADLAAQAALRCPASVVGESYN